MSYTLSPSLLNIGPVPSASGGYGDVYEGTFNRTKVCIKRVPMYIKDDQQKGAKVHCRSSHLPRSSSLTKPIPSQTFCQEAVTWKHLIHPNIVPLLGVTITPFQLISNWMSGGDLPEYLKKNSGANRLGLVGVPSVVFIPRSLQLPAIRRD